ncbi:helix-turn-helix domain-containing protein [Dokdonella sp.]|uniref:AraC family transcriptional regulator n=1 Tax=Dokdonella sp. TaxID=2291710 RepID=UPI003C64D69C
MVEQVALLLIGFSICAAAIILAGSLSIYANSAGGRISRASGRLLIAGLAVLQWMHWDALAGGVDRVGSPVYIILLFVVAPAFYLFFRGALQLEAAERPWHLVFYAPLLVAGWLQPAIAIPLSFLCGAAYAIHLGVLVFRLREQRKRFQIEMFALGVFAGIAVAVLALGLALPFLGLRAFVLAYSSMIGIASMLAIHVLLHFPDIATKAEEAVNTTYAVSTLDRVDREAAASRLHALMDDQVFADETLKLSGLATMMDLTPHQLSELINTRFGVGYSRYIREHRIAAAQRMLLAEPEASVLSIGLAVGFTSQSNFYAAFREITGEVPGRYRTRQASGG